MLSGYAVWLCCGWKLVLIRCGAVERVFRYNAKYLSGKEIARMQTIVNHREASAILRSSSPRWFLPEVGVAWHSVNLVGVDRASGQSEAGPDRRPNLRHGSCLFVKWGPNISASAPGCSPATQPTSPRSSSEPKQVIIKHIQAQLMLSVALIICLTGFCFTSPGLHSQQPAGESQLFDAATPGSAPPSPHGALLQRRNMYIRPIRWRH